MSAAAILSRLAGPAVAAALSLYASASTAAPERVVSVNLCTDQLAMLVAAPGQMRSVSFLAHDPRSSAMVEEASALPPNRGQAEEVFLMKPDLVVAGSFTSRATLDMLRRLGVEVVEFAPANSLDDIRASLRQMGEALGREARAAELIAAFDADLEAARAEGEARPRAALYYAKSYTLGAGTLADSVMEAAGLSNVAAELGVTGGGRLPLEALVMATPDIVVTGREMEGAARATETFSHPALAALRSEIDAAPVADRNWICGTPFITAAIRRLSAARDAVLAQRVARR
ncbi:MAG: ABC transporter substrate-binding protein [Pseudomonadota bacterium]